MIKLALPKGRLNNEIIKLIKESGISITHGDREYKPKINFPNFDVKLLKHRNILEMLNTGIRDIGFLGHDWILETNSTDLTCILETNLNPVKLIVAAKEPEKIKKMMENNEQIRIASEYEIITHNWIMKNNIKNAVYIKTYGATEVFPPDDSDLILDNTSTGSTLKANGLTVIDTVMTSTTGLYCNKSLLKNEEKMIEINKFVLLLKSVLTGRMYKLIEFNISEESFNKIVKYLPCMQSPTISKLYDNEGYAVKVCIKNDEILELLPLLKEHDATDILVNKINQIVR